MRHVVSDRPIVAPAVEPGQAGRLTVAPLGETVPTVAWKLRGRPDPDAPAQDVSLSDFPFTVGRHAENRLPVTNPTVSGRHAEFVPAGRDLAVRDLGSTNGTFVNGRRVQGPERLRDGDVVQFGTAVYTVRSAAAALSTATVMTDVVVDYALAHVQFDKLIDQPAVTPFFQPIVRLSDAATVGHEVLARSRLIGLETPGDMFQVAAERSLEPELSDVLRREGLRLGRALGAGSPGSGDFYLNTHPAELGRPGLAESVARLRRENPDVPLVLEIHEAAVTSSAALADLRDRLRDLDVRLAYDDFGAGQSRLMELVDVPPDVIKFDMHLIRGLPAAPPERRRLVGSLVRVVRDLGVTPLAEGVETAAEATVCRELGFELAQGYYFGRPAPAAKRPT